MGRLRSATRGVVALIVCAFLAGGFLVPAVAAAGPDKAEVVLVLDFSASILDDRTSRNRFGAALERIADRVDETSRDLMAGDATVTIVRFASKAADEAGCTDMKLFGSPSTVRRFADCLRSVAAAYRKGLDPALTRSIGIDTNYVAAMEQAAVHLPADAVRPTMILFSDGKHDVAGVPVGQVVPARDRLFGERTPFALLPVGMGLDPADRDDLEAGLIALRTIRDMPACASGTAFEWPQVVFGTADQAGTAVAVALQNATCTFTVEATPVPTASPTPGPTPTPSTPIAPPAAPGKPAVEPQNGGVKVSVTGAAAASGASEYLYECSADNGTTWPAEAEAGAEGDTSAQVGGLTNGVAYVCRAFASNGGGMSEASPLSDAVRPCGSFLECSGLSTPVLVGLVGLLVAGILLALFVLLRGRRGSYVVAVVDVVHSANLGSGSSFGISFERPPHSRDVTGIVADRGSTAEIRVRKLRGHRFRVEDRRGAHKSDSGEPVVIIDSAGIRHELVLHAFEGKAASAVSARR
jgi:hypothetical protein